MSEQPETLSAILAEMRRAVVPMFCGRLKIEAVSIGDVLQWADRIEAAVERERDEDRRLAAIAESDEAFARCARCDRPERAPGNAAAMREALTAFVESVERLCEGDERGRFKRNFAILLSDARAALAAPARNCDRPFRSVDEALGAYVAERGDGPHLGYCDAIKWAFGPAKDSEQ